jgi:hypothetical protein
MSVITAADTIIHGGRIATLDWGRPFVSALAIANGRHPAVPRRSGSWPRCCRFAVFGLQECSREQSLEGEWSCLTPAIPAWRIRWEPSKRRDSSRRQNSPASSFTLIALAIVPTRRTTMPIWRDANRP